MVEYYFARIPLVLRTTDKQRSSNKQFFSCTKFLDGEEAPDNVYFLTLDMSKDVVICDCPNRRRGAHLDDKHGKMLRQWLAGGEKPLPIIPFDL